MANYLLIRHSVEDYPKWKAAYDKAPDATKAGITNKRHLQDADDPNMVTLLYKAEDLDRAERFFSSDEIREVMQNAGVIGKPDIHFLKN